MIGPKICLTEQLIENKHDTNILINPTNFRHLALKLENKYHLLLNESENK